jgi:hypothetical protein
MAEKHIKVAPAMHDTQDKHVLVFNTVFRGVKPDVVKIGFGTWRYTMRHLARRGVQFGQKAGASSFLHLLGKLLHGLLRDNAAFSTSKRSSGVIEREKKCRPLPLAFFPQGKRLLHSVLF